MKRKIWMILSMSLIVLLIGMVSFGFFVFKQVELMGSTEMQAKAANYEALTKTSTKHATVFFGDSITELCPVEELYAEYAKKSGTTIINRGISAETTDHMLTRIEDIINLQPNSLVMLMGVNDLSQHVEPKEITKNIQTMIELVKKDSPHTHILLQAVYPVNMDRDAFYQTFQLRGRGNEEIKQLNSLLEEMAKQENISFVDMSELLAQEDGSLRKDYTVDGLHPNVLGYLAIRDKLVETLAS